MNNIHPQYDHYEMTDKSEDEDVDMHGMVKKQAAPGLNEKTPFTGHPFGG